MSLVEHAKRELEILGVAKEETDWIIRVIKAFASYGHSGSSAAWSIPIINDLLQFKNITPLTDDRKEWMEVGSGIWQSRRCSEAFSNDEGKTYYLLSEGGNDQHREPLHTSEHRET
jgi:hypothetical protein